MFLSIFKNILGSKYAVLKNKLVYEPGDCVYLQLRNSNGKLLQ